MSSRASQLLLPLLLASLASVTPAAAFREVGIDDQRLSVTGPPLDPGYYAVTPAVAIDNVLRRRLVCWQGNDDDVDEAEIYCDLLDDSGATLQDDVQVSFHGPAGAAFAAVDPAVAFNSTTGEYLVCWSGDTTDGGTGDDEFEIYCRILDENLGSPSPRLRISTQGGVGDAAEDALHPTVAYNFQDDNYLVCWEGDQINGVGDDDEYEIWCRTVSATGALGTALQVSHMGPDNNQAFDAKQPTVIYGGTLITSHEFLVCWSADDDAGGMVDGEFEIFCRRLAGSDGSLLGATTRMSFQGGTGSADFRASLPSTAFDPLRLRYLVCWEGNGDLPGLPMNRVQSWCGEWNRNLVPTGTPRRISFAGSDAVPTQINLWPRAFWNGSQSWGACYVFVDFVAPRVEVACQLLRTDLSTFGPLGAFVSSIGEDGSGSGISSWNLGRDPHSDEILVVWSADTASAGLADSEYEVFAQRIDPHGIFVDGFESHTTGAWSGVLP